MNKLVISLAKSEDAEDIAMLENQLEHDRYSIDLIKSSLETDTYLNIVAKINKRVVGYLSASIILDECSLIKIVVDTENRRRGIAQNLLEYLVKYLEENNINVIFLEVRKDNIGAINLYKKTGFEKQGERKDYYVDCDAELYYRVINDKRN